MSTFEELVALTALVAIGGTVVAYARSRDVFHPLVFIGPMMAFLYGWMPWKLLQAGSLESFFLEDQMVFVAGLNCLGVLAFVFGCLAAGTRAVPAAEMRGLASPGVRVLERGGLACGLVGLGAWALSIHNVGGFANAFSRSYGGGWDDSGYVRDAALLMIGAVALFLAAAPQKLRGWHLVPVVVFATPWSVQAALTARRGPTFMITMVLATGYYLFRHRRPPLMATCGLGLGLGYLILFLVSNRNQIHLGSDFELTTEVGGMVEKADTGNEFIYGSGTVLNAEKGGKYFWGRRYLAQILVRPVPSAVWPTKYEDFGVPELLHNAGTGDGFLETLGWEGAVGSAPGVVADLWLEMHWGALGLLVAIGWAYGAVWRRAVERGQAWATQYCVLAALSIYLVMQTMEAVIFRLVMLSVPIWISWGWARYVSRPRWEAGAGPYGGYLSIEGA